MINSDAAHNKFDTMRQGTDSVAEYHARKLCSASTLTPMMQLEVNCYKQLMTIS